VAFELNSASDVDKIFGLIKKLNVKITREPKTHPEYSEPYYAFYF
jgi:hypothetical protein